MSKLVYIVGYNGNMASRYKAILDFLGIPHVGHDKNEPFHYQAHVATHFFICTPTDRHLADIASCLSFQKPIFCEKPLSKELSNLLDANDIWTSNRHLISMVNQYQEIAGTAEDEPSHYDYFKTGTDGLYWDCINIIGLAKDGCRIQNTSPEWSCTINGKSLSIAMMDQAYIDMVSRWLDDPKSNWDYALKAHAKVAKILEHTCQKS